MKTQNWLLKQSQSLPDHIAVDDGQTKLTFMQLTYQVEKLVGQLNALNPGKKVGLLATNQLLTYQLALAIICSGRTIVWLNWRLADDELSRQVNDSQLQLCLVEPSLWRPTMRQPFQTFDQLAKIPAAPDKLVP